MGLQESWKCKRFVLELIFVDLSQIKSQSKNVKIEIKLAQRIEADFETRQNGSIIQNEHSEETVWSYASNLTCVYYWTTGIWFWRPLNSPRQEFGAMELKSKCTRRTSVSQKCGSLATSRRMAGRSAS